jgi:tRNA pseudouridine55 synthase
MNGILNVLKPPGMTSFDVVGYLRKLLKIKKIGHTGTLDPGAVGVLPICIGTATKAIEYIIEKDKVYRAELTLGVSTDTQDSSGKIIETREVLASSDEIRQAVKEFEGKILQLPPMYSAIKVEGKKLYELARNGITVEREPRKIEIYSIDIISIKDNRVVLMDVHCSKGTYIRTLCADIGDRLGCGGHMSFLIRSRAGSFDISNALTLEEIYEMVSNNSLKCKLERVDKVFDGYEALVLDAAKEKRFLNGVPIEINNTKKVKILRVYNQAGSFLGIGDLVFKQGSSLLKSKKLFLENV